MPSENEVHNVNFLARRPLNILHRDGGSIRIVLYLLLLLQDEHRIWHDLSCPMLCYFVLSSFSGKGHILLHPDIVIVETGGMNVRAAPKPKLDFLIT